MIPSYLRQRRLDGAYAVFIVLLLVRLPTVRGGTFFYPTKKGLRLFNQDTVNVSYASDYVNPTLMVFCKEADRSDPDLITQEAVYADITPKDGHHLVTLNYSVKADECWFNIRDDDKRNEDLGFNSVIFALAEKERDHRTTLAPTGQVTTASFASTVTSEPPLTTATSGEAAATTTAPPEEDSSSGQLSTGAKAGIGVGASLGALGLGALGFTLWLMRRRKNHVQADAGNPEFKSELPADEPKKYRPGQRAELDAGNKFGQEAKSRAELEAWSPPQELPT